MHRFSFSACETMLQFNGNLKTQFTEGRWYQGIRTVATFEFKDTRSEVKKSVAITEKEVKQYVRQIKYIDQSVTFIC